MRLANPESSDSPELDESENVVVWRSRLKPFTTESWLLESVKAPVCVILFSGARLEHKTRFSLVDGAQ